MGFAFVQQVGTKEVHIYIIRQIESPDLRPQSWRILTWICVNDRTFMMKIEFLTILLWVLYIVGGKSRIIINEVNIGNPGAVDTMEFIELPRIATGHDDSLASEASDLF